MASMFSQLFSKGAEPADIVAGPNRVERRAAAKKAASAKRRGQRAYQRSVIEAEAARYAQHKADFDAVTARAHQAERDAALGEAS